VICREAAIEDQRTWLAEEVKLATRGCGGRSASPLDNLLEFLSPLSTLYAQQLKKSMLLLRRIRSSHCNLPLAQRCRAEPN